MRIHKSSPMIFSATLILCIMVAPVAYGDETRCSIDWQRLQLTAEQNQQVQSLEAQWSQQYMEIQPSIIEDQRKLTRLLSDAKSDPVEIMALQQSLARKREQLRAAATTNYLKKRQILNGDQQRTLEDMIRQILAERQRMLNPGSQTDVMPDRIQSLMQRVRNIWPH